MSLEYLKRSYQNWMNRLWKILFEVAVDVTVLLAHFWALLFPGANCVCKKRKKTKSKWEPCQHPWQCWSIKKSSLSLRTCLSTRPTVTWLTMVFIFCACIVRQFVLIFKVSNWCVVVVVMVVVCLCVHVYIEDMSTSFYFWDSGKILLSSVFQYLQVVLQ